MEKIGIRALKNELSAHIRAVERGQSFLVTDRGVVVAELSPPRRGSHMREADIVADFEASGALAPPANPKGVLPAPAGAMTLRALLEELDAARGDRDLR